MRRIIMGVLGVALLTVTSAHAQDRESNRKKGQDAAIIAIVGDTAQRPLEFAAVVAILAKQRATTTSDGIVRMTLPAGEETFIIRRLGYQPQQFTLTLTAGDTLRFGAVLLPDPVQLTDIEVTADRTNGTMIEGRLYKGKMQGFAKRMQYSASPRSHFFTPDDIEKLPPTARITDLLRRAGMRTQFSAGSGGRYETAICRGTYLNRLPEAIIYLDGLRMNGNGASFDFNAIPFQEIQALEVYKGAAEIPAELTGIGADCVVMIWTK